MALLDFSSHFEACLEIAKDLKASHPLEAGQALTIRIVSVAYTGGLPEIIGVCAPEDSNQVIIVKCLEF